MQRGGFAAAADAGAALQASLPATGMGVPFEVPTMTGLCRGEVVGLRWGDVDLARGALWVGQ
ncbi:hypothetical protein DQ238_22075 [Geodermatophilus sp. TF02-6]|uniref:hypothetical protein n=1 Tax=Geodermatophilus sp. TF02-6 TaxID=2250575 RepID=UPI000DEB2738|nr:hypothetical protein [Geodermatophilus sp. TF02-6]RBY74400.1 hypothetical protein DQ238_22075 [Geodermatophilus sp. TF02-6]